MYVSVFVGVKGGALVSVLYDYSQHGDPATGHCCYTFCLKSVGVVRGVVMGGVNK